MPDNSGVRDFTGPAGRTDLLPRPAKILYTAFVTLIYLGLLTSIMLYSQVVGFSARATPRDLYEQLITHYQGSAAEVAAKEQSYQKLLQVTHFHLFTMPVILLILGHLLLMTRLSSKTKLWLTGTAIGATITHVLIPWGVYYGGRVVAWCYPITGALLTVSYALLGAVPIWQMWRPNSFAVSPRDQG